VPLFWLLLAGFSPEKPVLASLSTARQAVWLRVRCGAKPSQLFNQHPAQLCDHRIKP
jgi:hypothetical protein